MKKGKIVVFFLVVAVFAALIGTTVLPVAKNIKLGLDLQGGFEILYEVHPLKEGDVIDEKSLSATVSALNRRVNALGVSEPYITIEGENRIRVQLAGVEDQQTARDMLATEANLTFRDVDDNVMLDGDDLEPGGAGAAFDQNGQPIVTLRLKDAKLFEEVTREISKRPEGENLLVIWLDFEEGDSFREEITKPEPKFLSAPRVTEVIPSRDVQIVGNFTVEETKFLAEILNAGALPVQLEEIYSNSVGASLGEEAMLKTIYAGFIGVALIYLYMIIYYRFMGVIAAITLTIYIYLILVVFDWMNAVLTLPGIAALILGVGMAVDANILTYERIKEELIVGKSVMSAFKIGNRRALTSIFDANITTLLAAAIMLYFGTSAVQGFAVMLIISILMSFLTAVYGTRLLLGLWVNSRALNKKLSWFGVKESDIRETYQKRTIDFVKHQKKIFLVTVAYLAVGAIFLIAQGLNLGIDFESGSRIDIVSDNPLTTEEIASHFAKIGGGYEPDQITLSGEDNNVANVRFIDVLTKEEVAQIQTYFTEQYGHEPSISTVSPQVGKELARNAVISVLIASVGIMIYVAVRFQLLYGVAAVIGLIHDAFFIIMMFAVFQFEVNIPFIAAVLTVVGYSINDTIVTFDRIRENLKNAKKVKTYEDLVDIVNVSLTQTLARSINTGLTVLFAAAAIFFLGGEAIRTFSFAILVGLIAGIYSSLFLAAQLWLVMKGKSLKRRKTAVQESEA